MLMNINTSHIPGWWAQFSGQCARRVLCTVVLAACVVHVEAQQSLALSQLQLRYRVLSRSAKPDEATTAEVRKLEAAALEARGKGQIGEVWRGLHHAIALLEGKPWKIENEFAASLALTTDTQVLDPARPFYGEVRQLYPAGLEGGAKLNARIILNERGPLGAVRPGGGKVITSIATVPTDMVYEPLRFALDLSGVKSGGYQLDVELRNGEKVVQRVVTPVYLARGIDSKRGELEQRLGKITGNEGAKASVRYPFDLARVLNLGLTSVGPAYNFEKSISQAEEILAALEAHKDPFAGATGLLERHYAFAQAGEIMPYRVYVPKAFDAGKSYPLIIALHGLGGTETTMLPQANAPLAKMAEEHGYIVASPMGYRRNGGYGRLPPGASDTAAAQLVRLSEEDVMNVLKLMRAQYKIDPSRIYLMGHSMGASGTWNLGTKYADIWAALGPIAGAPPVEMIPVQKLKDNGVPVMVVHGDADRTAPVEGSRALVAEMKKLGVTHEYIEVPGGTHGDVVGPNIPKIVEYFNQHTRAAKH